MVRFAKAIEEPLRGVVTLFGVIAFVAIIPWLTDIEGVLQNWMEPSTTHAIIYFASMGGVIIVCGVAGYYLGRLVTWPLRLIIKRDDIIQQQQNQISARAPRRVDQLPNNKNPHIT